VVQERISDDECILVKGTKVHTSASIILRGPNDYQLDEMERSVHDSMSAVKRTLESGSIAQVVVPSRRPSTSTSKNLPELLALENSSPLASSLRPFLLSQKLSPSTPPKDSSELVAQLPFQTCPFQRTQEGDANEDEKTICQEEEL